MKLWLRADLASIWNEQPDAFTAARLQEGAVCRRREGRRTLRFAYDGRGYFLKYHQGVGWPEIAKNLVQLKKPVLGAEAEYRAIRAVDAAGLDTLTVAGFGSRGADPASRESFLVTDDLADCFSLEELGEQWLVSGGDLRLKRELIRRVARIVRVMHDAGVNHRDLYLGHFLMPRTAIARAASDAPLYLIDLHRSQVRRRVPRRWLVKDLGGLYFSVARFGLTRLDLLRFVRSYTGGSLRHALMRDGRFWRRVRLEAERIYRRYYEVEPTFPLQYAEHPGKDI